MSEKWVCPFCGGTQFSHATMSWYECDSCQALANDEDWAKAGSERREIEHAAAAMLIVRYYANNCAGACGDSAEMQASAKKLVEEVDSV